MNKLAKNAIIKGRDLKFVSDTTFKDYPKRYPLHEVKECHYEAIAYRRDDYSAISFVIRGKLIVEDTRDGSLFCYPIKIKEEVEILSDETEDGEGYIIPGGTIDLDDLALRIIQSSLPLQLVKNVNEPLPKGIKGGNVLSEEEFVSETDEGNFSLDGLPEYPSMDEKR